MTVLFADVVGFTSLAEQMDPEDVKHLIDSLFQRLADDIVSFGGVVDKILGDGIVALFGAPVAHEDDAERAVRAGLRMQQTITTMASEVSTAIQLRIGLNTGEVLTGMSSAGGDYTAMGDVMNIASRLEALAEPGRVLVGASTHGATADAISYRRMGFMEARGREGAVEGWVALSPMRPPGARRSRSTSFAGRQHELLLIEAQARIAVDLKRAQATVILGEAGMGKTRLAEEAAAMLAARWNARVLEGRAVPYGEANVWWPVAEIVRQAFALSVDTTPDSARAVLIGGLSIHLAEKQSAEIPRYTTALMHALGYETALRGGDPDRNRAEVTLALTNVLEAELSYRTVVLVLSDIHWAAESVQVVIRHVLNELSRTPLVVLMTAKGIEVPEILGDRHGSLVLHLGPLDNEASLQLLNDMEIDLTDQVAEQLVERSGGNPFFLEELAGLVATQNSEAQASDAEDRSVVGLTTLPDTLRGIIAARLDALDPQRRLVLEAAAVLGRSGTISSLEIMLAESEGTGQIGPELAALVDADFLSIDGARYSFRSDMVRDVAYGTLTKSTRAQKHYAIANYIESTTEESSRNWAVMAIALHYHAAAQLLSEVHVVPGIDRAMCLAKALLWLAEAGERSMDAGAPSEADRWFSQGLALAADDEVRATYLFGRARARSATRDLAGARADLDRLEGLPVVSPSLKARSSLTRGELDRKSGNLDQAAARLREAVDRLEALGEHEEQAAALRSLGMTEMMRGQPALARQALESSRTVARNNGDSRSEGWALQGLGWNAFQSGRISEAQRQVAAAEKIFSDLGDQAGLAWVRGLNAWVSFHVGDWDRAKSLIAAVMPETKRRGDPWAEAMMLTLSASIELWSGNATEAVGISTRATEAAERAEDLGLQLQARAVGARALVSLGRVDDGSTALEGAFSDAERLGDVDAQRTAIVSIVASAARLGDSERAIRWAARFDGGHQDPSMLGEADLAVGLALAMLQRGAVDEAAAQLAWADSDGAGLEMFVQAVGSIVAAAQGDLALVGRRAAAVLAGASTYLDQVLALLAKAAAAYQLGEQGETEELISQARAVLSTTDDCITPLLVDLLAALCGLTSLPHTEVRMRGLGIDPAGWRQVWESAITLGSAVILGSACRRPAFGRSE